MIFRRVDVLQNSRLIYGHAHKGTGVFFKERASASRAAAFTMRMPLDPVRLAALIKLVQAGTISGSAGREVFKEMVKSDESAEAAVERLGLKQVSGGDELDTWVTEVINECPDEVARYRSGKTQLIGFFVGQVMKKSGGRANPKVAGESIKRRLEG